MGYRKYCTLALFFFLVLGCRNKKEKEYSEENKRLIRTLSDTVYEDFDLISFRPVNRIQGHSEYQQSYLKKVSGENYLKIVMVFGGRQKNILFKKNNQGFYYYLQKTEQDFMKEYLYTVFADHKVVTFVLHKQGDEKEMSLTGFRVLYPLDKKTLFQRELIYKIDDNIRVLSFEAINIIDILKDNMSEFESEYFYTFDYKNKISLKYYHNTEEKKLILENRFSIFNAHSAASPYYFFWKQLN